MNVGTKVCLKALIVPRDICLHQRYLQKTPGLVQTCRTLLRSEVL